MFAIGVSTTLGYGFPLSVPDGRACPREGRARRLLACDEERPEWRCRSDDEQECDTSSAMPIATLILLRHGQSEWNGPEARFTGWCDVPLTVKGRVEAVSVGAGAGVGDGVGVGAGLERTVQLVHHARARTCTSTPRHTRTHTDRRTDT